MARHAESCRLSTEHGPRRSETHAVDGEDLGVDVGLVEAHHRAAGLWFDPDIDPTCTRTVELDLAAVRRTVAGPRRPQDPLRTSGVPASLGEGPAGPGGHGLPSAPVAIASRVLAALTRTGGGISRPRPFAASSALTAAGSKASAPIP